MTSVQIQPTTTTSETDILRHQLAAALQELEVTKNELREAQETIKSLSLSLSEQITEPTPTSPPQRTAPIGILYEWLDARFVRGRYGWPDDIRLHPEDKTKSNINHLATWQVCKEVVVIPDTKDANCSYADWLLHHAPDDVKGEQTLPLVGKATHFVSHAWGFEFQHLLRALRNFVVNTCTDEERNKGIYLWIDIFVVDQHAAARGEMGDDYWETAFREMVDAIGHTILVLDRLPAITPTVLTRIWCVWELYSTVNNKENRLSITMDSEINNIYKSCKRKELMEEMLTVISAIRSQDAEATVDSDRSKINALIQATEGGHAAVDRSMCRVLYALLLSMAACTLEDSNDDHLEAFRALSEKIMSASSSSLDSSMLTQRFHGRSALVWSLTLDKPKMSSILQDMGYVCDDVEVLNMSGYRTTKIERLPDGLLGGKLSCLTSLYLGNHKLNDIPLTFGTALPHLVQLDLSENMFVNIPVTLLELKHLQILNMANNQLSKNTFESLVGAIPSTLESNEGSKAIRMTLWPSLILLDIRLNDDLDNTTPDTLRMQIPSLKNVLFHTEPRERAITILLNRFRSQGDLGLAKAGDVKEIIDPGSGETLFYVAMTPGSAMQGWGKKALIANLQMKRAFLTQMGFHRVYWERNGLRHLGEPMSDEIGHPSGSGSMQIFERGNLNWLPDKGCFISEKEA